MPDDERPEKQLQHDVKGEGRAGHDRMVAVALEKRQEHEQERSERAVAQRLVHEGEEQHEDVAAANVAGSGYGLFPERTS
jgi:hypothetical protein